MALANKLMFVPKADAKRSVVLVIGEIGNGKSTTLNNIIHALNTQSGRPESNEEELFYAASE